MLDVRYQTAALPLSASHIRNRQTISSLQLNKAVVGILLFRCKN